jgi:hypothetical protein
MTTETIDVKTVIKISLSILNPPDFVTINVPKNTGIYPPTISK